MSMNIKLKKLNESVVLPTYQTEHAAGMDVSACIDAPIIVKPHERAIIPTGFAIALPAGYEAQIRARSGMAAKFGVVPANGVGTIDADYRGEVGVILLNTSDEVFTVEPGMRIAQIVIAQYEHIEWDDVEQLGTTDRATGGYGSTGA
ncbi:dUTP diphosphatase [Microbacteriaceae bacterium]|nr:dUTP diphosphatase [Candidatus Saccharibacteria bacterium]